MDDSYPALAHVISDNSASHYGEYAEAQVVADFVYETLKASPLQEPLFFLVVRESTMTFVRQRLQEVAESDDVFSRWNRLLIPLKTVPSFAWQQDYFQSFFDSKTGLPVLRRLPLYKDAPPSAFFRLVSGMQNVCPTILGGSDFAPDVSGAPASAIMGGNMEALPLGFCIRSEDQPWDGFAEHYCGSKGNSIEIDTAWLRLGHVDEVITLLKSKVSSTKCEITIGVASPDKGMELLEQNPNDSFYEIRDYQNLSRDEILEKRQLSTAWLGLCRDFHEYPSYTSGRVNCPVFTNGEVASILRTKRTLKLYNDVIQEKMTAAKQLIATKLRERRPTCEINFVDLPQLFWTITEARKDADGKPHIGNMSAFSLLPNPANAVKVPRGTVVPFPSNRAFRDYLEHMAKNLRISIGFVDTFDFAHQAGGNLHCITQSLRICRP